MMMSHTCDLRSNYMARKNVLPKPHHLERIYTENSYNLRLELVYKRSNRHLFGSADRQYSVYNRLWETTFCFFFRFGVFFLFEIFFFIFILKKQKKYEKNEIVYKSDIKNYKTTNG